MSRAAQRKDHPLSIRLPDADLAIIDRAAQLRGRSRTEFMRDAAVRAAEEAIMNTNLLRVSPEAFDAFVAMMDAPPEPTPALIDLFRRTAPWESAAKKKA